MLNTAIIAFAVLGMRNTAEEKSDGWKPSKTDVTKLEEKLKTFSCETRDGKKLYPFELYLESEGIISFGEFCQIQVRNPLMYDRMNRTDSLREWIAEQEMEKLFNAFPEERKAHKEKLKGLVASFKRVDKSVSA